MAPTNEDHRNMLRKISFALVAAAALGTAALAPTAASARVVYTGWAGIHDVWYGWAPTYYFPGVTSAEAIAYCARRYRSYDAATGTFLGTDGFRHYCQ
jgi:hypothetical protein